MQELIFALANGSMYALMALAIGIIYSTTRIINFAHGSVIMIGAMTSYWFISVFHMNYILAILLAILINILLSMVIYKTAVERLGDLSKNSSWIVTLFGASIIIDNIARMIFGTEPKAFPYLFNGLDIRMFGANIMLHEMMMIVIAISIGIAYQFVIQKTSFGRAVRAVSYKPDTARIMGIRSSVVVLTCFAISGGVAAIAGALIAPLTFASYTMTYALGIKAFAAALIGGLGNTKGAFVGGISLGLLEGFVGLMIPGGMKDAVIFLIMIVVIIVLPGGILGAKIFNKGSFTAEKI
ncbi:branched-chain amino acid ABC transporter permease [Psychrobacillus glaciei]|uniref:Branched-chain amino acid ABC transporter permease n=1 Tax=Psychrobacillus glaciei TaxID=2283160 RepID=A0A5J6SSC8_9BACI|nr:branched-chain amino acid ABC transporter permease [Psychrobacillus glaciei]QFG00414.1 branched-chain amino acid ABC transporter permease [Psychrobacillus glaciei]